MTAPTPSATKVLKTRDVRLRALYRDYHSDPSFQHLRYGSRFVSGRGNITPRIVFVSDVPTKEESRTGISLVGRERTVLGDMLKAVDLKPEHVFYTNVLKYRPHSGRDPREAEVAPSMDYLWDELAILKPDVVVPLGRYATSVFFDGYSFDEMIGVKVGAEPGNYNYVCMYSLANVLHNPLLRHEQHVNMKNISSLI